MISPWQMSIKDITELFCKKNEILKCDKRAISLEWVATLQSSDNGRVLFFSSGDTKLLAIQSLLDNMINKLLSEMNQIRLQKRVAKLDKQLDLKNVRP